MEPLISRQLTPPPLRAYLISHNWILDQCGIRYHCPTSLSNLEATKCPIAECRERSAEPLHCEISDAFFKRGQKLLSLELTRLNYNSYSPDKGLDRMLRVLQHSHVAPLLDTSTYLALLCYWKVGCYRCESQRHLYRNDSAVQLVAVAGLLKKEASKCLFVLEEYGQPVQHSQYLSRLYEIHPFTIIRQWRRCRITQNKMVMYHNCLNILTIIYRMLQKSLKLNWKAGIDGPIASVLLWIGGLTVPASPGSRTALDEKHNAKTQR